MAQLSPTHFLRQLAQDVPRLLPPELRALQTAPRGRLLKLWYGQEAQIHYEVWLQERNQLIELGLHCEGSPEQNEFIRRGLAAELLEIKHRLGQRVEVEPWDRGWSRVYETHPFYPLDEARVEELARRCAAFISALQPIYEEAISSAGGQAAGLHRIGTHKR